MITGRILNDLLTLELNQFPKYALGVSPQRLAKTTKGDDIIIIPYNLNSNHWVLTIIDVKKKTFIFYGMTQEELDEPKGAYQEVLGPLEVVLHPLQNYAANNTTDNTYVF